MAWKHTKANNKPARGASFMGWGGPAQGAGRGGPARPFSANSPTRHAGVGDPEKMAERKRRGMAKEERIADLVETLEDIAFDPTEATMARVSAANSALDRLAGKPEQVNKNLNVNVFDNLTTAEQRAVAEALDALATDAGDDAGGTPATHH